MIDFVAIDLARVAAFLELIALDPFGKTDMPDVVARLKDKYYFAKFPQSISDIDPQKGIELQSGRFDGIPIDRLGIFPNGIVIDTRSSTDTCERVLEDLLELANKAFGAKVVPARKNFISQIVFQSSSMRLSALNPILDEIAQKLTPLVSFELKENIPLEMSAFIIGSDNSQRKVFPGNFSIERRTNLPFSQDTYFSVAPVRTAVHMEILEIIESVLSK